MKSFIKFFVEPDISLFQIFMWTLMASLCPPFASVLNFIIFVVWSAVVRIINDKILEL